MKEPSEKISVLIVDDSPFSRRLTTQSLDPRWFEIVGFADGLRSTIENYRTFMPKVVTIDIAMSEMDGLEVIRRIVAEEPDAKIVLLSGTVDAELVKQAEAQGAAGVVQKPFDPTELMNVLINACEPNMVDDVFNNRYPLEFVSCFTNFLKRFIPDVLVQPIDNDERLYSSGIAALVGITGRFSGRMVFDLSTATANNLAERLLKQIPANGDQINDVIGELANIVAGNASSKLNKEFQGIFLRVSPPVVFTGEKFSIASPNLDNHAWEIDSPFGKTRLSIGFKREEI
jgi:CheY-like chemotaxis protein